MKSVLNLKKLTIKNIQQFQNAQKLMNTHEHNLYTQFILY